MAMVEAIHQVEEEAMAVVTSLLLGKMIALSVGALGIGPEIAHLPAVVDEVAVSLFLHDLGSVGLVAVMIASEIVIDLQMIVMMEDDMEIGIV